MYPSFFIKNLNFLRVCIAMSALTFAHVSVRLPACLSAVVHDYFGHFSSPYDMASRGQWEDCTQPTKYTSDLLFGACESGYYHIAEIAIKRGASINDRKTINVTCAKRHFDIINLLLKNNSCPNVVLQCASQHGFIDAIKLTIIYGAKDFDDAISWACATQSADAAKYLIGRFSHAVINWNNKLNNACSSGCIDIIELLIEHGANDWNYGLGCACLRNHLEIAKMMIAHGANDWNWGLALACGGNHWDIIRLMVDHGATYCSTCMRSGQEHIAKKN